MKKELFVVATIITLYFVFITVFTAFDNQEEFIQPFNDSRLSETTALALAPFSQTGSNDSKNLVKASLRDPMPPPAKKPKPRRKKKRKKS